MKNLIEFTFTKFKLNIKQMHIFKIILIVILKILKDLI